jgi:hypothetical protein
MSASVIEEFRNALLPVRDADGNKMMMDGDSLRRIDGVMEVDSWKRTGRAVVEPPAGTVSVIHITGEKPLFSPEPRDAVIQTARNSGNNKLHCTPRS